MGATMLHRRTGVCSRYRKSISAQVIAGAKTGRQAIGETYRDGARTGLKAFTDKAGGKWTPEAYAQVSTRSNNQRWRNVSGEKRSSSGWTRYGDMDLIRFRQPPAPALKDARLSGANISLRTGKRKVPAFSDKQVLIGEIDGFLGANCSHTSTVYTPGQKRHLSRIH